MRRLATVDECRQIDERSQAEYELSGEVLMEAAGALAAREIEQSFAPEILRGPIVIVCGPGNNGADGLVVARHLAASWASSWASSLGSSSRNLQVLLVAPEDKRSPLFTLQLRRCFKLGIRVLDATTDVSSRARSGAVGSTAGDGDPYEVLAEATLIIDAIFGIGFRTPIRPGPQRTAIERIIRLQAERSKSKASGKAPAVVSLDVPSGLDADRGMPAEISVKATMTLTFGVAKRGFFVSEGPAHVGRLRVLPIGFPQALVSEVAATHEAFTASDARRFLPRRSSTSNKSTHGHAAIFAGSPGMWGAAHLAATSAYRAGAGYVTLATFGDLGNLGGLAGNHPEILTARADDERFWSQRRWKVAGIGPGLGTGSQTERAIRQLMDLGVENVVVDADALTVIASTRLRALPSTWILTPHAGELSRLLGASAREIEADRFRFAREAAEELGCHVLLKGFRTVVASPEHTWVVLSGNSALAKAGTGDVLTGLITGLLAQGLAAAPAALTGAYVHGRIADEWVRSGHSKASLVASDLTSWLPEIMAQLERGGGRGHRSVFCGLHVP